MNKGMLTIGIIFLSLLALLLVNILTNYSTGGELDYYLVKETADAAIEDAMDKTYARFCGLPRMDKEKFVENFVYRFASSVDATREYDLKFYDINEIPPKVSIQVDSLTVLSFKSKDDNGNLKSEAANITTRYSAILESQYLSNIAIEDGLRSTDPISRNYDYCRAVSDIIKSK